MRRTAGNLGQVLIAATLCIACVPASAAYYSYQGELAIQSTLGQGCQSLKATQAVTLTIHDTGAGSAIEGYFVLPELISVQRLSGSDLAHLNLEVSADPDTHAPRYQLSLAGSLTALSGGAIHTEDDYQGSYCFIRSGQFTLASIATDSTTAAEHRFTQDGTLFSVLQQVNAASALSQHKQFPQAVTAFSGALELATHSFSTENPQIVARVGKHLADAQVASGDLAGAEKNYAQALRFNEQAQGPDAADNAIVLVAEAQTLEQLHRQSEAEPLYRRAVEITAKRSGEPSFAYANSSGFLANLLQSEGRYLESEPLFEQIFHIETRNFGDTDQRTASGMNNLANSLEKLARYDEAEALYKRALAINEHEVGPDSSNVAVNLINLAVLYETAGRPVQAEPLLRRALTIREQLSGEQSAAAADVLTMLATDLSAEGSRGDAEMLYRRALTIHEQLLGPATPAVATDLQSLGLLLYLSGRYGEAEPLMRRALQIDEQSLGPDKPIVGAVLDDLAWLLRYTARREEAESAARRALSILEQALGPDHPQVATALLTVAGIELVTLRYADAEVLDKRALAIRERAFGPMSAQVAVTLNNLSNVYQATNRFAEAEPLLRRALEIDEHNFGDTATATAQVQQNLGRLLANLGQREQALPLMQHAYRVARSNGVAPLVWQSPARLMDFYGQGATAQAPLAIYYGKVAVNTLQQMRGNLSGSSSDTQTTFVDAVAPIYRQLAELLVNAGRLGEAQQILAMLKEQELFNYTERGAETDARQTVASLTPAEQQLEASGDRWIDLSKEYATLQRRYKSEGEAFKKDPAYPRLLKLRAAVDTAQASYDAAGVLIAKQASADRAQRVDDFGVGFQDTLRELGHGAVLAQYFILDDKVEILLTTPEVSIAREAMIPRAKLNEAINDYRQTLISRADPLPQAQALYHLLIGPIEQDLKQAGAQTLMLSLDDTLRYLPFAALHDGHGYLIERYALSLVTEAARDHLVDRDANNNWKVWGLGVTRVHDEGIDKFPALPMVGAELSAIAGPNGILKGELMLDPAFDANALRDGLDQSYPIIHIASHFKFDPANADDSYLLLGDGNHMSLKQIGKMNFKSVELLTLSACETALGGPGSDSHGAEVESLGAIAQKRGARAVLATLWPVADTSTALLMRTLYAEHEQQQDKAEALRQAQLALIHGTSQVSALPETVRSAISLAGPPKAMLKTAAPVDPKAPYAHPYFWAPFILMGSWQ